MGEVKTEVLEKATIEIQESCRKFAEVYGPIKDAADQHRMARHVGDIAYYATWDAWYVEPDVPGQEVTDFAGKGSRYAPIPHLPAQGTGETRGLQTG